MRAGLRVLVNGAGGGVGTYAVQIAAALGAEVTGVCSTRNAELVRSIGAAHVIDYTTGDFTGGRTRYDVILDNVSSLPLSRLRGTLTRRGPWCSTAVVRPATCSGPSPACCRSVPRANEDRLVVPDTLGMTIKLSFLEGLARLAPTDYSQRAGAVTIYRADRRDVPRDPLAATASRGPRGRLRNVSAAGSSQRSQARLTPTICGSVVNRSRNDKRSDRPDLCIRIAQRDPCPKTRQITITRPRFESPAPE